MNNFLGSDLSVIPYFIAQDASSFDLVRRARVVRVRPPERVREVFDLGSTSDRENLAQALILRLLTPVGSLAALGHAAYGSRLHELIGEHKTDAMRNLCRAFVLEVVAQEPRVDSTAVELTFDPKAETSSSLVFTLAVRPLAGGDPLNVSIEVGL